MAGLGYFGNAKYCYANSVAMLLAGIDEKISPSLIEVLTGVGLGACLENDRLLFFSGLTAVPDTGISKAMEILGFSFEEKFSERPGANPFEVLEYDLRNSTAVLGPLDFSYLVYAPGHQSVRGAAVDHFVLAYEIDQEKLYLHDPAGYPHVSILRDEMLPAWRAEDISYRRGYYRYWTCPKRITDQSGEEVYRQALDFFRRNYEESSVESAKDGIAIGREAILRVTKRIEMEALSTNEYGHLVSFALQLGAKRALDFASFLGSYDRTLADLKYRQSLVFGEAHSSLVRKDWSSTAGLFRQLADLEVRIEEHIKAL